MLENGPRSGTTDCPSIDSPESPTVEPGTDQFYQQMLGVVRSLRNPWEESVEESLGDMGDEIEDKAIELLRPGLSDQVLPDSVTNIKSLIQATVFSFELVAEARGTLLQTQFRNSTEYITVDVLNKYYSDINRNLNERPDPKIESPTSVDLPREQPFCTLANVLDISLRHPLYEDLSIEWALNNARTVHNVLDQQFLPHLRNKNFILEDDDSFSLDACSTNDEVVNDARVGALLYNLELLDTTAQTVVNALEQQLNTAQNDEQGETEHTGWSTFRGDTARTGVRPGEAGPGGSISVAWEVTTADVVEEYHDLRITEEDLPMINDRHSWPVVTNDHVVWLSSYEVIGSADTILDPRSRIIAVDPSSGSIDWSHEFLQVDHLMAPFGPEVEGDEIYVPIRADDQLEFVILDQNSGDELSRIETPQLSPLAGQPQVTSDTIYVIQPESNGRDSLHAIDTSTGETNWTIDSRSSNPPLPDFSMRDGEVWYFDNIHGSKFVGIDMDEGSVNSELPIDDLPSLLSGEGATDDSTVDLAPPVIIDNVAYAGGDITAALNRELSPLVSFDILDNSERWRFSPPGIEGIDNPAIDQQVPPDSEEDLRKALAEELPPFAATYGYPVIQNGLVLITGIGDIEGDSQTALFAIDQHDGTLEWDLVIEDSVFSLVGAGDIVYLVSNSRVEAISMDGERLDSTRLDSFVSRDNSPALGFEGLFVPSADGIVAIE